MVEKHIVMFKDVLSIVHLIQTGFCYTQQIRNVVKNQKTWPFKKPFKTEAFFDLVVNSQIEISVPSRDIKGISSHLKHFYFYFIF